MTTQTSAGTKLAVSAAVPATFDASGYDAVVYTSVGGVESIPELGASSAVVTFQPLDGPEEQHKGAVSYGQIQVPMANDTADAGQTILRTAAEPGNNGLYTFKKTYANGDKEFWRGRVFSSRKTVGGAGNVVMMNCLIGVSTKVIEKPATV